LSSCVSDCRFTADHISYLREIMPHCEDGFFDWLSSLDCSQIKVYAMEEGTIVFPREPLIRIEGPIGIAQMLETTLLNLVNFPSLVATNAARMRLAAGKQKKLLEFGLRRAQVCR
jgi:nicotinate phosphoribosyltransferase